MKRNTILFSVSLIIILVMLVGLTSSTAQTQQPAMQPVKFQADIINQEMAEAPPQDETLYYNGL